MVCRIRAWQGRPERTIEHFKVRLQRLHLMCLGHWGRFWLFDCKSRERALCTDLIRVSMLRSAMLAQFLTHALCNEAQLGMSRHDAVQ